MINRKQLILIIMLLLATACTTAVDNPLPEPTATAPPNNAIIIDLATEEPTASPTDEPVIFYGRSGGIAGRIEEWTIYPDGQIVSLDGETAQADPDEVTDIVATAVTDGFHDLDDEYLPDSDCCDLITYTITLENKTVITMDGANRPEVLDDTITAVEDLIFDAYAQ